MTPLTLWEENKLKDTFYYQHNPHYHHYYHHYCRLVDKGVIEVKGIH